VSKAKLTLTVSIHHVNKFTSAINNSTLCPHSVFIYVFTYLFIFSYVQCDDKYIQVNSWNKNLLFPKACDDDVLLQWQTFSTLAIVPKIPSGDTWVWRTTVEWYWQWKTEEIGENPVQVQLWPPQIPHGLIRARSRAPAVRGRRLTAWAMSRPSCTTYFFRLNILEVKKKITITLQNLDWKIVCPKAKGKLITWTAQKCVQSCLQLSQ
jgi:hypothetical protein